MSAIKTSEVKEYLREGTTENDADIGIMIPEAERDAIDFCNNNFFDGHVYRYADLEFKASTGAGDKITDDDGLFKKCLFGRGMDIWVDGRNANQGLYTITTGVAPSSGTLVLESSGEILTQGTTDRHPVGISTVHRVKWPRAIKPVLAKMVGYLLTNAQPDDRQSESFPEGESITYAGTHYYPKRVLDGLRRWKKGKTG
jgi:hypothetical protein